MTEAWGEAPGQLYVDTSGDEPAIALAALRFGNVVLMIQPPRGFGENPVAIYHDPDMAPSHHYLAAYRWLEAPAEEGGFGAHAVVHLGKHGTLEWLPGKGIGMAADCAPDAVLGNLPMVYPFIVNDPGEGTQAKRRAHATVVDHLVPPMARAETYGDMAKLEYLLDEYATVSALDPEKVPTLRAQIWTLIQAAQLHHDLHTDEKPDDDGVRRVRPASRRVSVRDQGRADPRRAAHPRRCAGRRGAGQPGARRTAGSSAVGWFVLDPRSADRAGGDVRRGRGRAAREPGRAVRTWPTSRRWRICPR